MYILFKIIYIINWKKYYRTQTSHRTQAFHRIGYTKSDVSRIRFRTPFRIEPGPM